MNFSIEDLNPIGIQLIHHKVHKDDRGSFSERWHPLMLQKLNDPYRANGKTMFLQSNVSRSHRSVVRGLHFQWDKPQSKLVRCIRGSIIDLAVDIRHGSPTIGQVAEVHLWSDDYQSLWIPAGFAHGFIVTSEYAEVEYACTATYNSKCEGAINVWDKMLNIVSLIGLDKLTIMSIRDRTAMSLYEFLYSDIRKVFPYAT